MSVKKTLQIGPIFGEVTTFGGQFSHYQTEFFCSAIFVFSGCLKVCDFAIHEATTRHGNTEASMTSQSFSGNTTTLP